MMKNKRMTGMMMTKKNNRSKSSATAAPSDARKAPRAMKTLKVRRAAVVRREAVGEHVRHGSNSDGGDDRQPFEVWHEGGDIAIERAAENDKAIGGEGEFR